MTAIQIQAALLRAKLTAANRDACIKSFFVGAPAPVAPPKQVASALAFGASHTTVAAKQQHSQPSSQQQQQQQQQQILPQWSTAHQQAAVQHGNGRSDFFGESSWNFPPTFYGSSPPAQPLPAYQNEFDLAQPTQQQSLTSPGAWAPTEGFEASPTLFGLSNFDDDDSLFGRPATQTSSLGARRNIFDGTDIDESNIDAFFQD